jgi:hypothetical protein
VALRMTSALGLVAMIGLAWGLSEQRSKVRSAGCEAGRCGYEGECSAGSDHRGE